MKNKIRQIHGILHKAYGNLNWWPTTLENELHPKYHGKKLNDRQRFEIIVGAILTQNTSWKNVEKAIYNLNKEKLLSADKISKINIKKLASAIKPSGYYNQKAEKLKIFSNYLLKNYNGILKKLFSKNIPELRKELLSIKGIGPETADSIILYSAEKPIFVIDNYTKRIFSRLGFCNENCKYDELQELFMKSLKPDVKMFNNYHALLVEHAKNNCRKKPVCTGCLLSVNCRYKKYLNSHL